MKEMINGSMIVYPEKQIMGFLVQMGIFLIRNVQSVHEIAKALKNDPLVVNSFITPQNLQAKSDISESGEAKQYIIGTVTLSAQIKSNKNIGKTSLNEQVLDSSLKIKQAINIPVDIKVNSKQTKSNISEIIGFSVIALSISQ
ncbi:hypothetical protein ABPG72_013218 [Tetrahymena utriculariae]